MPREEVPSSTRNEFLGAVTAEHGGTVNAVGNDQINNTYNLSIEALHRRIRYTADREALDREMRAVVPPPGLEAQLATLEHSRVLVLAGGPRTGLSTAARHRWHEFAARNAHLASERLFADDYSELTGDLARLSAPSALLLDVSHTPSFVRGLTEDAFGKVQSELHEKDAYMVVAVGIDGLQGAERSFRAAAHLLGRPDPIEVVAKRMSGSGRLDELKGDERFLDLVRDLWPPRAAEIAEFLDGAPTTTTLDALIEAVESQANSWSAELRELVHGPAAAGDARALLLASGALQGAARDSISFAAQDLAQIAGEKDKRSVMEQRSLEERFGDLETILTAATATFNHPNIADAVLPFAWNQFPNWRDPIRAWLDRLLEPGRFKDDTLANLMPRLLSFAAATGAADIVVDRAARIAAGPGGGSAGRRRLAAELLVAGAIDPTIGQQVRHRLWSWSVGRSGGNPLVQRVVAEVCGDAEYASRFPRNALTRLGHLLGSNAADVQIAALDGLVSAARYVPPPTLIDRLGEWAGRARPLQGAVSVPELVVKLLSDETVRDRLRTDWLVRDPLGQVRALWRAVFASAGQGTARRAVGAWLVLADGADAGRRFALADLLVEVARENFWALALLNAVADELVHGSRSADPEVYELRAYLHEHVSQAKVEL
ncbi:hypothetical protein [Glycomyces albidus]|uniref:Uncharacterized protein n=1 Tax=Glycomyces albidus TaxID=2656774 RepID=A0A6L5G5Y5_9ACTN|nr:hypothetical protein [Glycomyces albidus]MQM25036.1 hypothetical protein [Glycomyces albidus]